MPDRQFRQRLEAWHAELQRQIFTDLMPVSFDSCPGPVPDHLSSPSFSPMPVGTAWGTYREYRCFSARIRLPVHARGRRVVLVSGAGGEQLVFLNGRAVGSIDKQHRYVTLFRKAPESPDAEAEILIESYAGNGPRLENLGPCPPERKPVPEPGLQCRIQESRLAVCNEEAYQLFLDVETLMQLERLLPETSLRRMQIEEALRQFTHIVNFECSPDERKASYIRAREALKPCLACKNGSTAPMLHLIGQSHIDLAWLWPMEETDHKVVRTFANQLELMDEYEEYRFLACEPALLERLMVSSPDVWNRLMDKFKSGQIIPDGAFYVECDTNLPSGESLIRQLLWGTAWFRETFGRESRIAWQPDTFGFSPCLPQLLNAFGITGFATQKLLRADPECERFPYQDFIWEGIDGSRVQALCFFKNNARTDPTNLWERWEKHRSQERNIDALLYPFGYGDGGGGADRDMLEYLRREQDLEGLPRTKWSSLEEHFRDTAGQARHNLWQGELYLAWHRGAYTVQRQTKLALRNLELALHDAEFLVAGSDAETRDACHSKLRQAWHTLLLHQFHDIAAGVGIRDVHAEAVEALNREIRTVRTLTEDLARKTFGIVDDADAITVLNTLPFARKARIPTPWNTVQPVELPASGTRVIQKQDPPEQIAGTVRVQETEEGWDISNGVLRFTLCRDGTICSLMDLRSGLPLQAPGMRMNDFRLYSNVEPVYDAWELSREYLQDRLDAIAVSEISVTFSDSVFQAEIRREIDSSQCLETVTVCGGEAEIGFEADVDWQERHKLLKVHFESNLQTDRAIHDMQFCHLRRPAHRSTREARDRYEVCQHKYTALFEETRGISLMNRAIYGVSCDHGDIALTLLRAPCVPDDTCDRGKQHFSFALAIYACPFAVSSVTTDSYAYSVPPLVLRGRGRTAEGIRAENAMIETVKPADRDGSGTVLRVWEYRGGRTRAALHLPEPRRICSCSFSEENVTELAYGDHYSFELPPFGIRTFMLL